MNEKYKIKPVSKPPLEFAGISLEYTSKGEKVQITQRGSITSYEAQFYRIAQQCCNILGIKPVWNLLARWNKNETLVFIDNLPITLNIRSKTNVKKGQLVSQKNIADIDGLSFEDHFNNVNPKKGERVICIISVGYAHGLYFDVTGDLDPDEFKTNIGELFRLLKYPYIYGSLDDGTISKMMEIGWFPFIELLGKDCEHLTEMIKAEKFSDISEWSENTFSDERIKKISERWVKHQAYPLKRRQFEEGFQCFLEGKFTASISTLNPLIEGVFNEYLIIKTGKGISYNSNKITESIYKEAISRFGENSLLLPQAFREYLEKYFFKHNKTATSDEVVRNASAHGRSTDKAFTREKAVIVILTIDQLFFYMDRS